MLAGLVALALAPGTWVRSPLPARDLTSPVVFETLTVKRQRVGALVLEEGWVLDSRNDLFGGWSAMTAWRDGLFLAGSDSGRLMTFARPDRAATAPELWTLSDRHSDKHERDLEALTYDEATDQLWAGFENTNAIMWLGWPPRVKHAWRPPAMADWPENGGTESLVRFADSSLLVIAERVGNAHTSEALLFPPPGETLGTPLRFAVQLHDGHRPVEAKLLPDGRLLILMRTYRLGLPPRFTTLLAVADPAGMAAGTILPTTVIARIADPLPSDNYEGMIVTRESGDRLSIWLISDDNDSPFQETMLLRFSWDGSVPQPGPLTRQKARR